MGRRLPDRSPYGTKDLVCAGPGWPRFWHAGAELTRSDRHPMPPAAAKLRHNLSRPRSAQNVACRVALGSRLGRSTPPVAPSPRSKLAPSFPSYKNGQGGHRWNRLHGHDGILISGNHRATPRPTGTSTQASGERPIDASSGGRGSGVRWRDRRMSPRLIHNAKSR